MHVCAEFHWVGSLTNWYCSRWHRWTPYVQNGRALPSALHVLGSNTGGCLNLCAKVLTHDFFKRAEINQTCCCFPGTLFTYYRSHASWADHLQFRLRNIAVHKNLKLLWDATGNSTGLQCNFLGNMLRNPLTHQHILVVSCWGRATRRRETCRLAKAWHVQCLHSMALASWR
jgi:hypothetical protein